MWKNDLSYLSIPVTKIDTRTRGEAKTKEAFAKFPLSWARRIGGIVANRSRSRIWRSKSSALTANKNQTLCGNWRTLG